MAPFDFYMDESARQKWILPVQFQEELKKQIKLVGPQKLDDWWNFFENAVEDEYTKDEFTLRLLGHGFNVAWHRAKLYTVQVIDYTGQ